MAKPYDLYIRFLVTKGYSKLDSVNSCLKEQGLYPITEAEFEYILNQVFDHIPEPISRQIADKRYEGDFIRWMKVLEVHEFWYMEKPFKKGEHASWELVYDINQDPQLRMTLRALLIKGCKPKDICQDLNAKFSYMLKTKHVELYRDFFWNPARMNRASWKAILAVCSDFERSTLFTCLTESLDVLKADLDLPTKANILPTYTKIFSQCAKKVNHYMKLNTKESNFEARQWIDTMLQIGEKVKKYETGNTEDFGKTLQMEFDFVSSDFPSPDEITLKEINAARNKILEQSDNL